jgi:aconitase A
LYRCGRAAVVGSEWFCALVPVDAQTSASVVRACARGYRRRRCWRSLTIHRADGKTETVPLTCRIDTLDEVEYFRHGGILQYVLRGLLKAA